MELALKTCEAAMRQQLAAGHPTPEQALAALVRTSPDLLFRRAFRDAG